MISVKGGKVEFNRVENATINAYDANDGSICEADWRYLLVLNSCCKYRKDLVFRKNKFNALKNFIVTKMFVLHVHSYIKL